MRQEQRKTVRRRTEQLLYLEMGADNGGMILNLSEQGCNFHGIGPILEPEFNFDFTIGGGYQVRGKAHVSWLDKTKKRGGLRFLDLSAEARGRIRNWLDETKASDVMGEGAREAVAANADSLAKLRRKTLREEARLQWEAAENGKQDQQATERNAYPGESLNAVEPSSPAVTLTTAVKEAPARKPGMRASTQTLPPQAQPPLQEVQILGSGIFDLPRKTSLQPSADEEPFFCVSSRPWRGVAAIVVGAVLASTLVTYHREVGHALIWLGGTLAGDEEGLNKAPASDAGKDRVPAEAKPVRTATSAADTGALMPVQNAVAEIADRGRAADSASKEQISRTKKRRRANVYSAEDLQTLWAQVGNGDTRAEVALADHYLHGDGVVQSCGQAKVLLTAAVRRGNLDAKRKLDELLRTPCP